MKNLKVLAMLVCGMVMFVVGGALASDKPEVYVQLGHTAEIQSVDISPDNKFVISSSQDGAFVLWNAETAKEIKRFSLGFRTKSIEKHIAAFSSKGTYILAGGRRGVKIYELKSGALIKEISGLEAENTLSMSEDKNELYTDYKTTNLTTMTNVNKSVPIFNATSKNKIYQIKIVENNVVEIYSKNSLLKSIRCTSGTIKTVAISDDAKNIATVSDDGVIKIWDANSGKLAKEIVKDKYEKVVSFMPDSNLLMSDSYGFKDFFDINSGIVDDKLKGYKALSNNNKIIATTEGRSIILYSWPAMKKIRILKGELSELSHVAFSPDNNYFVSTFFNNKIPLLWDLKEGKPIIRYTGHKSSVNFAAFSEDGNDLYTASNDKSVKKWEAKSGNLIWSYETNNSALLVTPIKENAGVMYADENRLVGVLNKENGTFSKKFVDNIDGLLPWPYNIFNNIAVSDNGKYVVVSGESFAKYDIATGNLENSINDINTKGRMVISDDARYGLVFGWDHNRQPKQSIFDLSKSTKVTDTEFRVSFGFSAGAFSHNNKIMAVTASDLVNREGVSFFKNKNIEEIENIFSDSTIDKSIITYIYLVDVQSGNITESFKGVSTDSICMTFTSDDKYLLSAGNNGVTKLWSTSTGKELAQFISFKDGEWITITPEGYYNSSKNGDKYLNVRIGNNVYGIENYREAFYRPDLVKLALSGQKLEGMQTLADIKQAPSIAIINTPETTKTNEVKVTIKLTDQGGGIGDVRLFLNGSAVSLDNGRRISNSSTSSKTAVTSSYTLKLSKGENIISAIAFNKDNSMQSNAVTQRITTTFASSRKPSLHALVIGVNEFKNPKLSLNYAVADAKLFSDTIAKSAASLFETVKVTTLTTPVETTRDSILAALKTFQKLNPDDVFIFYVASHGTVDDGEYFMITSNVGSTRTEKLKTDAPTQRDLKEQIANIPATKKMIIIDTCNAGALGETLQVAMLTRGMSEDTAMKILSRSVGSTILSASSSVQEALEGYNGHGLFTWVLVQGLKGGADKGKSGFVKTTELADYVDSEVPALAEQVFKKAQYPTVNTSGNGFPIGKVDR